MQIIKYAVKTRASRKCSKIAIYGKCTNTGSNPVAPTDDNNIK
jgi:hypothetical protein